MDVSFLHISYAEITQLVFRRCDAFREACFIGHCNTGNTVAAPDKTAKYTRKTINNKNKN